MLLLCCILLQKIWAYSAVEAVDIMMPMLKKMHRFIMLELICYSRVIARACELMLVMFLLKCINHEALPVPNLVNMASMSRLLKLKRE